MFCFCVRASLVAQTVKLKRLPATTKTWVRSLGREDPLEKEMATYSSILAWRIPWTEEPGGLVHGVAGHDGVISRSHVFLNFQVCYTANTKL